MARRRRTGRDEAASERLRYTLDKNGRLLCFRWLPPPCRRWVRICPSIAKELLETGKAIDETRLDMTEDQIRADERRRWAKAAFLIALDARDHAKTDPTSALVWKTFMAFAHCLLDNNGPSDIDFEQISRRLKAAGFKIGADA